jgi:hypothetical protein
LHLKKSRLLLRRNIVREPCLNSVEAFLISPDAVAVANCGSGRNSSGAGWLARNAAASASYSSRNFSRPIFSTRKRSRARCFFCGRRFYRKRA